MLSDNNRPHIRLSTFSADQNSYEQAVAGAHMQLGEKDFARVWAERGAMTPAQVLAEQRNNTKPFNN